MSRAKFVSYLRVSTKRQGQSGLGLEAQREAVASYLRDGSRSLVAEVVEIESGGKNDRAKLAEALRLCRLHGATLLVAKLDRLSRDAGFLMTLDRQLKATGLKFAVADMPDANETMIGFMAILAQTERRMIAERTKAALAQKKRWYEGLTEAEREELRSRGKAASLGGDRGNIRDIRVQGVAASVAARAERATSRAEDVFLSIQELRREGG